MKIEEFAKKLNEDSYLQNIKIPILDGFQIIPNQETIFTAVSKEHYMEQFLCDGKLDENETFEDRLKKVINDTKNAMKDAHLENPDDHIQLYKKYSNDDFKFYVYLQDNILLNKWVRQFNIYFLDDKTRAFYQVSFCSCPFTNPNQVLKKEIDPQNDFVTAGMITTVQNIMSHISYKEK